VFFGLFEVVAICSYVSGNNSFPEILSPSDEERYITAYTNGDMDAKSKLIEHNLRLVAHIVKKYSTTNKDSLGDLISIGTIGLIKGVNTYKADKNVKLATYAARCIDNAMLFWVTHITPLSLRKICVCFCAFQEDVYDVGYLGVLVSLGF